MRYCVCQAFFWENFIVILHKRKAFYFFLFVHIAQKPEGSALSVCCVCSLCPWLSPSLCVSVERLSAGLSLLVLSLSVGLVFPQGIKSIITHHQQFVKHLFLQVFRHSWRGHQVYSITFGGVCQVLFLQVFFHFFQGTKSIVSHFVRFVKNFFCKISVIASEGSCILSVGKLVMTNWSPLASPLPSPFSS